MSGEKNTYSPKNTDFAGNTAIVADYANHREETNHLGNVLAVVSDRKVTQDNMVTGKVEHFEADIVSAQDYYPFGMIMPGRSVSAGEYRYGFNSMEQDDEWSVTGGHLDFGARIYDSRLGRWLTPDPSFEKYDGIAPYVFGVNAPILIIDPDGRDIYLSNTFEESVFNEPVLKVITEWENNHFSQKYLEPFIAQDQDMKINYFTFWKSDIQNVNAQGIHRPKDGYSEVAFNTHKWYNLGMAGGADQRPGPGEGKFKAGRLTNIAKVSFFFHEVAHANMDLGASEEHRVLANPESQIHQDMKKGLLQYAEKHNIELSEDAAQGLILQGIEEEASEFFNDDRKEELLEKGREALWTEEWIDKEYQFEQISPEETEYDRTIDID